MLVALPWHLWQSFRKQVDKNRVHVSASRKALTADSAPTEVTPYKYEPLGADGLRSLRLVTLLAGLPDQHEVECHISHYALDQCPPYEALSYCWGGIRDKRTIRCNGAHFNVSANLRSALLNLRFDNRSRLLWIDAICINQEDLDEKARQVSIMSHIYSHAQRTVIWLGEAAADSHLAFSLCAKLTEDRLDDLKRHGLTPDSKDIWGLHPQLQTRDQLLAAAALLRLLKRPWFERMWIVQEIGIATEALVTCGRCEMDWDVLYFGWLVGATTGAVPADGQNSSATKLIALNGVRQQRKRIGEAPGEESDLLTLLMRFRYSLASDPRDKVYALYGLARVIPSSLTPNYYLTVTEAYKEVAIAILKTTRDLRLFSAQRANTNVANMLPTWVPDWSYSGPQASYLQKELFGSPARVFTASRGTESSVPIFQQQGDVVLLSGYVVDEIMAISAVLCSSENVFDADEYQTAVDAGVFAWLPRHLKLFFEACRLIETHLEWENFGFCKQTGTYLTGEDHRTVYWRTLFADRFPGGNSHDPTVFLKAAHRLRYARLMHKLGISKMRVLFYLVLFLTIPATLDGDNTFEAMIRPAFYRRLARTKNGYLALVPQSTKVGDSIAILKGGSVPFVIRPRRTQWELVGDSYVHGIMYGEAFREGECKILRFE